MRAEDYHCCGDPEHCCLSAIECAVASGAFSKDESNYPFCGGCSHIRHYGDTCSAKGCTCRRGALLQSPAPSPEILPNGLTRGANEVIIALEDVLRMHPSLRVGQAIENVQWNGLYYVADCDLAERLRAYPP